MAAAGAGDPERQKPEEILFDSRVLDERGMYLVDAANRASTVCRHERASQHLRFGLSRRALMLWENRRAVNEIVASAGVQKLNPYTCNTLNIHLNSFYVHVRGALDNLAWAVQHEFKLLPGVQDEQSRRRSECNLFGRTFRQAIRDRWPTTGKVLDDLAQWEQDFRSRRDPTAHRIPLYAPPGYISSDEEVVEYRRLSGLAADSFRAGRHHEGTSYLSQAGAVGKYAPIVWEFEDSGQQVRGMREILAHDASNLILAAETVLKETLSVDL